MPPIAPSTYHERVARRADPPRLPPGAERDAEPRREVRRVFESDPCVYGVRKVWHRLRREGVSVARCTVARPMRDMGLAGVIRGKPVRMTDHGGQQGRTVPARPRPSPVSCIGPEHALGARPHMRRDPAGFVYVACALGSVTLEPTRLRQTRGHPVRARHRPRGSVVHWKGR